MALSACGEKREDTTKDNPVTTTAGEESTESSTDRLPIEANTAFLSEKGIPEEDAQKIAEVIDKISAACS